MYYFMALIAYLITVDYIGGGDLGSKLGYTTEEVATGMYKLFEKKKEEK